MSEAISRDVFLLATLATFACGLLAGACGARLWAGRRCPYCGADRRDAKPAPIEEM